MMRLLEALAKFCAILAGVLLTAIRASYRLAAQSAWVVRVRGKEPLTRKQSTEFDLDSFAVLAKQ